MHGRTYHATLATLHPPTRTCQQVATPALWQARARQRSGQVQAEAAH